VLPGFLEGHVSIQDEAAQLAVSLLPLESGLRVLDACCAPGGKTCHMLESEPQLKQVIALDNDATRLPRVRENIARLNLSAMVVHGDGCVPETWWDGELFDRILLDAPCSALGVIRRHPDIKLLRNPEDIDDLAKTQAALLHSLWPLLRPGGFFLYATCSIIKQENEKQIQAFLAEYKDAVLVVIDKPWGHWTDYGLQVLPGDFNTDGFFYCLLTKK